MWGQILDWVFEQTDRWRGGVGEQELHDALLDAGFEEQDQSVVNALAMELNDRILARVGPPTGNDEEGDADGPKAKEGTLRWFQLNANEKIGDGVDVTVRQMCYHIAMLQRQGGMTLASVDTMCRGMSHGGIIPNPGKNLMPR